MAQIQLVNLMIIHLEGGLELSRQSAPWQQVFPAGFRVNVDVHVPKITEIQTHQATVRASLRDNLLQTRTKNRSGHRTTWDKDLLRHRCVVNRATRSLSQATDNGCGIRRNRLTEDLCKLRLLSEVKGSLILLWGVHLPHRSSSISGCVTGVPQNTWPTPKTTMPGGPKKNT